MPKVDDNYGYVSLATTDDLNLDAVPLRVDPVTGELLIEIHPQQTFTHDTRPTRTDDNYAHTELAVTDDADAEIRTIKVDPANDLLLVDGVTQI